MMHTLQGDADVSPREIGRADEGRRVVFAVTGRLPTVLCPPSSRARPARWPGGGARSSAAACCSPRPAPAPARRSPTSCPPSSAASASSSRPARRTCRSRSSTRTCRCSRGPSTAQFTATCMKGRGNYLCLHRFEQFAAADVRRSTAWMTLIRWARASTPAIARRSTSCPRFPFWTTSRRPPRTASAATARGYGDCFVTRMRQRAADADVVIVNHHLLCADAALRRQSFGEVIPECHVVIVDEAHQLEDVATQTSASRSATIGSKTLRRTRAAASSSGRQARKPAGGDGEALPSASTTRADALLSAPARARPAGRALARSPRVRRANPRTAATLAARGRGRCSELDALRRIERPRRSRPRTCGLGRAPARCATSCGSSCAPTTTAFVYFVETAGAACSCGRADRRLSLVRERLIERHRRRCSPRRR